MTGSAAADVSPSGSEVRVPPATTRLVAPAITPVRTANNANPVLPIEAAPRRIPAAADVANATTNGDPERDTGPCVVTTRLVVRETPSRRAIFPGRSHTRRGYFRIFSVPRR